jgi:uncharacterized membrane protein YphA (DoxX/SURF4 family)
MTESMAWEHGRPAAGEPEPSPLLRTLSLLARLALGFVFLIAGAEKLTALDQFAHNIYNYQLLPMALVNIVALLFVWAEIVVGVLLIAGAAVRGSALVSGIMLLLFIVAILTAMARGLEIDCGCFVSAKDATAASAPVTPGGDSTATAAAAAPPAGEKVGWPKVFEDTGLLALAVFLVWFPRSWLTIDGLLRREGKEEKEL